MPEIRRIRGGLLGVSYQIGNSRDRFSRFYDARTGTRSGKRL